MFYPSSRVTVGFYGSNPPGRGPEPDVIVRARGRHMALLQGSRREDITKCTASRWRTRAGTTRRRSARRGTPHLFHDPVVDVDGPELFILERVSAAGGPPPR
jgi:hypothetical protein